MIRETATRAIAEFRRTAHSSDALAIAEHLVSDRIDEPAEAIATIAAAAAAEHVPLSRELVDEIRSTIDDDEDLLESLDEIPIREHAAA